MCNAFTVTPTIIGIVKAIYKSILGCSWGKRKGEIEQKKPAIAGFFKCVLNLSYSLFKAYFALLTRH